LSALTTSIVAYTSISKLQVIHVTVQ
jgi:hypothetical protein